MFCSVHFSVYMLYPSIKEFSKRAYYVEALCWPESKTRLENKKYLEIIKVKIISVVDH